METTEPAAPKTPPLTHRETLWIVAGVLLPVFMASLDQSLVATALPTIGREFGATSQLSWVVSINLLTSTAATPLYGKIGDTRGRRATLLFGITIFVIGAICSALAPNILALIAARGLQGVGAAGLIAQAMTVLGDIAPPRQRARYYTWFAIAYTTAGGVGPALGGWFAESLHWSFVFWIYVPMGVVAFAMTAVLLRRLPRHEKYHRLDVTGAALLVAATSTLMLAINAGGKTWAWGSFEIVGLLVASALLWALFLLRLSRAAEPLIPLGILRNAVVLWGSLANALGWAGIIGLNIYMPLYLQTVLGRSPAEAGLAMIALMATVNASALAGAQTAARMRRYKLYPMASLLLCVACMSWLAVRVETVSIVEFQIVIALTGLGFGPGAPITSVAIQNTVMLHQLSTAISAMTFARNLAGAIIVAALGAIVLHTVGPGASITAAAGAFRILFCIAAGCFAAAFVCLLFMEERPLLASNESRMG